MNERVRQRTAARKGVQMGKIALGRRVRIEAESPAYGHNVYPRRETIALAGCMGGVSRVTRVGGDDARHN